MQIYKLSVCGASCLLLLTMCCNIARPQGEGTGLGMGGFGGMGGDMEGGLEAYGPSREIEIVKDLSDDKPQRLTANRVHAFSYRVGSLKPEPRRVDGYAMGAGGGGEGGYVGEMMDGYGGGGGMSSGGIPGGPGMVAPGSSGSRRQRDDAIRNLDINAYVFDQPDSRSKIELCVPLEQAIPPSPVPGGMGGYGMAGSGGYGSEGGMSGMMGGGMMGAALAPPVMVRFETLAEPQEPTTGAKRVLLERAEVEIVADVIRQSIWKQELVQELNRHKRDPQRLGQLEQELKAVLTEEYDTQLSRQELEISRIEMRTVQLRDELARRRTAKQRVVDVQLGRIVLEAQGLLGQ